MPRPSSPTRIDQVSWYSISLEAFERLPHLSFKPLNEDAVGAAIGQQARHEQTADAGFGLRQRVEPVGDRHREEPFVAGDRIDLTMRAAFDEACSRLGLAQIGAALLLGHRIADDGRALGFDGKPPRIVIRRQRSLPPCRKLRLAGKSGNRGVSHSGRATDAVLDLIPEIAQRLRARNVRLARASTTPDYGPRSGTPATSIDARPDETRPSHSGCHTGHGSAASVRARWPAARLPARIRSRRGRQARKACPLPTARSLRPGRSTPDRRRTR